MTKTSLSVLLLMLLSVSPASAQEFEPDSLMTVYFDEIVVTATRGAGEALQVPMAVGTVDLKDFARSRRFSLNEALWSMPGVLVQSRAGGQDVRLTVRGFGARGTGDRSNAATVRGVKILVDGFPETEPDGRTSLDLINLSAATRVEVVRSNVSTLFGNASGGVVNIETQAHFSRPFVDLGGIFGSFGLRRSNLRLATTVSSGRVLLSLTDSRYDGWRANSGSRSTQLQSSLFAPLDEATRLRILLSAASNEFHIPGPLTQAEFDSDPQRAHVLYAERRERRFNRVGRLGVGFSRAFSREHEIELLLYLSPRVLERSERNTYRDFNRYHVGGGVTYQWRPEEPEWLTRITAGIDESYQDGTILFYNLTDGERGDSLRTNKREGANTAGAFLRAEIELLEDLSLVAGGRFDRQSYLSEIFAAGARQGPKGEQLHLDHFTPSVGLLYRLTQDHSLYANVSGGLEAPAFNEVDPPPSLPGSELNPFLKPMTSTTFEIGLKGVGLIRSNPVLRSFSYSLAAYVIRIKNEIVPFEEGSWFFSAGKSRRIGFEAGTQVDMQSGFALKSALTVLDAKYEAYANELGDFSGRAVPGIPPIVLNARLRYASRSGLAAELGGEHVGAYYADDRNTARVRSYTTLSAGAGYTLRIAALTAQAFVGVNNVTGRRYAASAFINPTTRVVPGTGPSPSYLEPGLPRNFFAGIDVRVDL